MWGQAGVPNVGWGNFEAFTSHTALLNPYVSGNLISIVAWMATVLEVLFAVGLIVGFKTRIVAFSSGVLLLLFGLSMSVNLGLKAPLDYSVFTASSGAFLLATCTSLTWSIDRWIVAEKERES